MSTETASITQHRDTNEQKVNYYPGYEIKVQLNTYNIIFNSFALGLEITSGTDLPVTTSLLVT